MSGTLKAGGRRVGTIVLEGPRRTGAAARRRIVPALASLLGVAIDRERLAQEALEAEALRRSDSVKTAVLRAVSHDLRSPLMAILTSASALARADLELDPADRRDLIETILGEAGRLDRLVANLLDLSRLQAGVQAEPVLLAIDDLVVQALDEVGEPAQRVTVSFADALPAVRADARQIQRVLVNLIDNALKYSPSTEPVRVQVTETPSEVVVRVVDHGPGVAPRELDSIFEPFQRGSTGNTARGPVAVRAGVHRGARRNDADAPRLTARGDRRGRRVPRLPTSELHHRDHGRRRRRTQSDLISPQTRPAGIDRLSCTHFA